MVQKKIGENSRELYYCSDAVKTQFEVGAKLLKLLQSSVCKYPYYCNFVEAKSCLADLGNQIADYGITVNTYDVCW